MVLVALAVNYLAVQMLGANGFKIRPDQPAVKTLVSAGDGGQGRRRGLGRWSRFPLPYCRAPPANDRWACSEAGPECCCTAIELAPGTVLVDEIADRTGLLWTGPTARSRIDLQIHQSMPFACCRYRRIQRISLSHHP